MTSPVNGWGIYPKRFAIWVLNAVAADCYWRIAVTKSDPHVQITPDASLNPVMSMIAPGRRAEGEDWIRYDLAPTPEGGWETRRSEVEAPADGSPIFVPAMGNLSWEMVDFILGHEQEKAKERAKGVHHHSHAIQQKELFERVNAMWQDFCEEKLRMFRGQTQIGPGGMSQREKLI